MVQIMIIMEEIKGVDSSDVKWFNVSLPVGFVVVFWFVLGPSVLRRHLHSMHAVHPLHERNNKKGGKF